MKNYIVIIISLAMALFTACQSKVAPQTNTSEPQNKSVELTHEQFETAKMVMGAPVIHSFMEVINSKGYLKAAPSGIARVVVPISGVVKRITYKTGEWVNKGDALFALKGDKIVDIQEEYLQINSKLAFAGAELSRVKKLTEANVTANKDYQMALNEYQVLKASHDAMLAKFELLNIDSKRLEGGVLVPEIVVKAPISGYISQISITMGEYLDPLQIAMEIINNKKLELNFFVFENALSVLNKGQKIEFFEPDRKNQVYAATVEVIGKSIDQETKTIPCIATIDNIENLNLVNGMYAECNIIVNERLAYAIPTEAIIKDGLNHFVLVKSGESEAGYSFSKMQIEIGKEELQFTEILTTGLNNVLLQGLYNLNLE